MRYGFSYNHSMLCSCTQRQWLSILIDVTVDLDFIGSLSFRSCMQTNKSRTKQTLRFNVGCLIDNIDFNDAQNVKVLRFFFLFDFFSHYVLIRVHLFIFQRPLVQKKKNQFAFSRVGLITQFNINICESLSVRFVNTN